MFCSSSLWRTIRLRWLFNTCLLSVCSFICMCNIIPWLGCMFYSFSWFSGISGSLCSRSKIMNIFGSISCQMKTEYSWDHRPDWYIDLKRKCIRSCMSNSFQTANCRYHRTDWPFDRSMLCFGQRNTHRHTWHIPLLPFERNTDRFALWGSTFHFQGRIPQNSWDMRHCRNRSLDRVDWLQCILKEWSWCRICHYIWDILIGCWGRWFDSWDLFE